MISGGRNIAAASRSQRRQLQLTLAATVLKTTRCWRRRCRTKRRGLGPWRPTGGRCGSSCSWRALYYGNVTIRPRMGAILGSGWEIRIQHAAREASVGKSQRRKDPSSWISWSSTTI
jgi:hypothetical protein